MNLLAQSRVKVANTVADRLIQHFDAVSATPAFFWMPGQDPMTHQLPVQSLAALYWQGSAKQRQRFVGVLLDLAGRRAEHLPLKAVQELLLTVGSIGAAEALLPFVRVLGARTDLAGEVFNLYGAALQVAKGFGPVPDAWDAVREIACLPVFPEKLVFDAFDIGVTDIRSPWAHWFERLEPAMMRVTNFSRRVAMVRRIRLSAKTMAGRVSTQSIERGLMSLLGDNVLEPERLDLRAPQQPRGMLAASLFLIPSAPLVVRRRSDGSHYLDRSGSTGPQPPVPAQSKDKVLPPAINGVDVEDDVDEALFAA